MVVVVGPVEVVVEVVVVEEVDDVDVVDVVVLQHCPGNNAEAIVTKQSPMEPTGLAQLAGG